MTPNDIDIFVNRLLAMYPNTFAQRRTLEAAWRRDHILLEATTDKAAEVLERCVAHGQFPTQFEVRTMFKPDHNKPKQLVGCWLCDNTGWWYPSEGNGVKPCPCRKDAEQ
jgi:hypothetical protein